jgi:hypothetical protein
MGIFIDPTSLPGGVGGAVQLLFLLLAYASILFVGSTSIADGSELLLLLPEWSGLVGSVVLPVLGAVPDGAIVLFSGLGPDAQEQLDIGVGALAGSTIMLLTIPWFMSVYSGRVSFVDAGPGLARASPYSRPKLAEGGKEFGWLTTGVECTPAVRAAVSPTVAWRCPLCRRPTLTSPSLPPPRPCGWALRPCRSSSSSSPRSSRAALRP